MKAPHNIFELFLYDQTTSLSEVSAFASTQFLEIALCPAQACSLRTRTFDRVEDGLELLKRPLPRELSAVDLPGRIARERLAGCRLRKGVLPVGRALDILNVLHCLLPEHGLLRVAVRAPVGAVHDRPELAQAIRDLFGAIGRRREHLRRLPSLLRRGDVLLERILRVPLPGPGAPAGARRGARHGGQQRCPAEPPPREQPSGLLRALCRRPLLAAAPKGHRGPRVARPDR
mmetsp:Transcript_19658/g.48031  ORF Transcript_19658/g.48031 Transcript_19658/m.48031 type:complete len:231 (+) Transcript_19658:222-914(+)